jgi:hypothetical protein
MAIKIKLFDEGDKSIVAWWANFFDTTLPSGALPDKINEALLPYNATFRTSKKKMPWGVRTITFKTKQDYLMFVLKWSGINENN